MFYSVTNWGKKVSNRILDSDFGNSCYKNLKNIWEKPLNITKDRIPIKIYQKHWPRPDPDLMVKPGQSYKISIWSRISKIVKNNFKFLGESES